MAIRKKFAVSAEAEGDVAFTVGRGLRQERNIERQQRIDAQKREISARLFAQQIGISAQESKAEAARKFSKEAFGLQKTAATEQFQQRSQADLEKIKFTSDLNERVLARRKLDEGLTWDYTPSQQKRIEALRQSQATLDEEFGKGERGKSEYQQLTTKLAEARAGILPQKVKKPQTPQDMFNRSMVEGPGGINYLMKPDGSFYIPVNPDAKLKFEVQKFKQTQLTEASKLIKERTEIFDNEGNQVFSYQQALVSVYSEMGIELPQAAPSQQDQKVNAALDDFVRTGRGTREEGMAELQRRVSGGTRTPSAEPRPQIGSQDKLFEDLPEAKQKELLSDFRKEQNKLQRSTAPKTFTTPIGRITRPRREAFKFETDASFIKQYNENLEFRRKTGIFERVKGALPATWEDATEAERDKMVAIWNSDFLGFAERELSKSDMKAKVEDDPDVIRSLLGNQSNARARR